MLARFLISPRWRGELKIAIAKHPSDPGEQSRGISLAHAQGQKPGRGGLTFTAGCGADGRQRSRSFRVRCSTLSRSMWSPRSESGCSPTHSRRATLQRRKAGFQPVSPGADHSSGANWLSSAGVGVEGASRCVAMINFLSSPAGLCCFAGMPAAGSDPDLLVVIRETQPADEAFEE
jgi:hypothetical protein